MKIELTKHEYEALLDLVCLGDWILHANVVGEIKDAHSKVEQKILSLAAEAGCDDRVVYEPELKEFVPAREYEESDRIQGVLDDYEDESFWTQLAERMARRDLERKHTAAKLESMEGDERMAAYVGVLDVYEREFEVHGIDRLTVQATSRGTKKRL